MSLCHPSQLTIATLNYDGLIHSGFLTEYADFTGVHRIAPLTDMADGRTSTSLVTDFSDGESIGVQDIRSEASFVEDRVWLLNLQPWSETSVARCSSQSSFYQPLIIPACLSNRLLDGVDAIYRHPFFLQDRGHTSSIRVVEAYRNATVGAELARCGDQLDSDLGPLEHCFGPDGMSSRVKQNNIIFGHTKAAPPCPRPTWSRR